MSREGLSEMPSSRFSGIHADAAAHDGAKKEIAEDGEPESPARERYGGAAAGQQAEVGGGENNAGDDQRHAHDECHGASWQARNDPGAEPRAGADGADQQHGVHGTAAT